METILETRNQTKPSQRTISMGAPKHPGHQLYFYTDFVICTRVSLLHTLLSQEGITQAFTINTLQKDFLISVTQFLKFDSLGIHLRTKQNTKPLSMEFNYTLSFYFYLMDF